MPWIAAGMVVAGAVGSMMSGNAQKKAAAKAAAAQQAALEEQRRLIEEVGMPPDQSARIVLKDLQQAGLLTPELEEAINLDVSKRSQIQEDPELRKIQVSALQQMAKRGRAGLTAEERAEFNKSRGEVQRDLQAKQAQIINEMQMRGQSGGGAEIASRLLSSQDAADRASEEADRIQAAASARALQAMQAQSGMAGDLRGQDFDVESFKASAEDEFNRFNVENQIARQTRNVGVRNVAQEYNLGEKQRIQDTNTNNYNDETYNQLARQRQYWSDKLDYAGMKAGIARSGGEAAARTSTQQGQNKANMISGVTGAVTSGLGGLSNYYASKPAAPAASSGASGVDLLNQRIQR